MAASAFLEMLHPMMIAFTRGHVASVAMSENISLATIESVAFAARLDQRKHVHLSASTKLPTTCIFARLV
jgi:hypothetical protein